MTTWGASHTARGYATIDFETTGLWPERHDRAIEVAVVHSDPDGTITGHWETIINPGRDLGRQDIHGVTAREVLVAPPFEGIAGELIDLLSGRVIVAHNASFDIRFLDGELNRLGYWPGAPYAHLCTMRTARTVLAGGCRLVDCCAAFDIELSGAHRASVDAYATAQLLGALIASTRRSDWDDLLAAAPVLTPYEGERMPWLAREGVAPYSPGFLERIIDRIPDVSESHEQAEYLALMERCLLDRYLSEHEKNALVDLAERYGIGRSTVERLHHDYFIALVRIAWADGVITETERADIQAVGELLEIAPDVVDYALAEDSPWQADAEPAASAASGFTLQPGDEIVLTGEMTRQRSDWEDRLREQGYVPKPAVTKKVRLVVAADPDSLSGKARKARDYGIPIVGEEWLLANLG